MLSAVVLSCITGSIKPANAQISVAQAFYALAHQNNTQKIKSLLERGYSIESTDEKGYNSVCISVVQNDKKAYNTLLSFGANKNPTCLKKIPDKAYQRFFGSDIKAGSVPSYVPDTPYLIGTTALAAGAVTAAYLLRGDTDGSSSKKDDSKPTGDKPQPPTPVEDPICPENSSYSYLTKKCECSTGYDHFGDENNCYQKIENCASQQKNKCAECLGKYVLKDDKCYAPIPFCTNQDGDTCLQCETGYGIHKGNGKTCYMNIPHCVDQNKDTCTMCEGNYGTHGDSNHCYLDIEHCVSGQQVLTACRQCEPGYSTLGDPNADICYNVNENPCKEYDDPNTVPTNQGTACICNPNKGYTGEPGNCTQAEAGEYYEGDGIRDEWKNLNELYCNSHGQYKDLGDGSWICNCYLGYDNASGDCSECDTEKGYDKFGSENTCFKDIKCKETYGEGFIQKGASCTCDTGYVAIGKQCFTPANCSINEVQVKDGSEPDACQCKPNFNETCTACINDNFEYDEESGSCVPKSCPEKWSGKMCDTCPQQYKITEDGNGEKHCGLECADNRLPISSDNEDCSKCQEGYVDSPLYGTCVMDNCSLDIPGYIRIGSDCVCDEASGYALTLTGECIKKGEDLIGLSTSNINNSAIIVENDGEFRDVYGMKPYMAGEDDEVTYYDEVYNANATKIDAIGTINIKNQNSGNINVYGIYAPSQIYNAAAKTSNAQIVTAKGFIEITDINSVASIYGIYGSGDKNIYNSFAYSNSQGGLTEASQSTAKGSVKITRDETSFGATTGIEGSGDIYNAYVQTTQGVGANVSSTGNIDIENEGSGTIIGIKQNATDKVVNNAYSFMNSPVSNAEASGTIKIKGAGTTYGIMSNSEVVNSETQFAQSFTNKDYKFLSQGLIDVTTTSDNATAYGIYLNSADKNKHELYNAKGYNSKGTIMASNTHGGSAYGLYSNISTYTKDSDEGESSAQDGETSETSKVYYNNVYNAFRSSKKYGGDDVAAEGNITVNISGTSSGVHKAIGAYSAGNMINAFANSGGTEKLESIGNIIVNDSSDTINMKLYGIESGGVTTANAYNTGVNTNIATNVVGNIEVNILEHKGGSTGEAAGIYTDSKLTQEAFIYNAALINDRSNVEGNITVQSPVTKYALNKVYGIYATSIGTDVPEKYVYNAYYTSDSNSEGTVRGTINVKIENRALAEEAGFYGIYVVHGKAYNVYTDNEKADVVGVINVDAYGSNKNSVVVGMYGSDATLNNSGKATINVNATGSRSVAYGIKGENAIIYNGKGGEINVYSKLSDAYGIYLDKGMVTNDVDGTINVNGAGKNYGIYASSDDQSSAIVYNMGTISVTGGDNIGIYASGEKTEVHNSGKIILGDADTATSCQGSDCNTGQYIVLANNAKLNNTGTITSSRDINFDAMGGEISLGKGGKFISDGEISGTLNVATDTVQDSFEKTVYIEDALRADNVNNVELKSKSYLYKTSLQANDNGSNDVKLEMKDFSEVYDKDVADYYKLNYEKARNAELFNFLKTAETKEASDAYSADLRGKNVLPNITMENLKVQRSLDRTLVGELFKEGDDIRKMIGGDTLFGGRDDHGTLTGYDLDAQSMYALYDKKLDNHYRLGLGLSMTHMNTDYNNDSSRKNFMIQGYVPLTYTNGKGLSAVSMARLGYADGEYKRRSLNGTFEADTNEITYGLLNELRYKFNVGSFELTPFIGLNAIGWYQDSIHEGDSSFAVNVASSHVFSLESALGLYLDKEIEFDEDNKLNIALGAGYYHEFANPYRGFNARNGGTLGHYRLRDIEHLNSRNRGILSAKVNYDYKNFSIYGELLQYLEKEYPLDIDVGLKYKF